MAGAVDFDRQACGGAEEVEDVISRRVLPTKFQGVGAEAEALPEQHLGQ
jgi:hypothetical protein